MQLKLAGKVAIVTASTDGIGLAIAKRLLNDGAQVVISSRNKSKVENALMSLDNFVQKKALLGLVCHVAKQNDRNKLFDETLKAFKRLDILVSNAAVNPSVGPILECSETAWDKIFEVNVKASFMLAKEAYVHIRKNDNGGSIIFISSIGGYHPIYSLGAYSVSKTALFSLTKAIASDLAPDNIRVNCVAPGVIETKFSQPLHGSESVRDHVLTQIPLKRIGQPNEISGTVSFLASDDATYITGETIVVAGGMQSRL